MMNYFRTVSGSSQQSGETSSTAESPSSSRRARRLSRENSLSQRTTAPSISMNSISNDNLLNLGENLGPQQMPYFQYLLISKSKDESVCLAALQKAFQALASYNPPRTNEIDILLDFTIKQQNVWSKKSIINIVMSHGNNFNLIEKIIKNPNHNLDYENFFSLIKEIIATPKLDLIFSNLSPLEKLNKILTNFDMQNCESNVSLNLIKYSRHLLQNTFLTTQNHSELWTTMWEKMDQLMGNLINNNQYCAEGLHQCAKAAWDCKEYAKDLLPQNQKMYDVLDKYNSILSDRGITAYEISPGHINDFNGMIELLKNRTK